MSKRKMFLRMITASLLRRRSRMLIALLSIAVGAAILSGLVTIYYDVPRQMSAQFRNYGANMLLLPAGESSMTRESAENALQSLPADALIGATPYRYVRMDMVSRQLSFTTAGTDFEQVMKTSPYFHIEGSLPENDREVLLGKAVADQLGMRVGRSMELTWQAGAQTTADHAGGAEGNPEQDRRPGATLTGSAEGWQNALIYVTLTLDDEAKIKTIAVDASLQTEEFGGRTATDETFLAQFIGKSLPLTLNEAGAESGIENNSTAGSESSSESASASGIDALSGATVSSGAVVRAINEARAVQAGSAPVESKRTFTVTGILDTGGEEEDYIFMSLKDLEDMTGEPGRLDVMELSVQAASTEDLQKIADTINANAANSANASAANSEIAEGKGADTASVTARLVKRVTRSETTVLGKLQSLIYLVTVVVLLLTMISVSTT
ncbi:MAG: ABC transporter permease, partial [Clostridia bacterium]